ncbi:MAG: hypothetical protein ACRD5Z_02565, partial [Bryobacteraceae bacterium]
MFQPLWEVSFFRFGLRLLRLLWMGAVLERKLNRRAAEKTFLLENPVLFVLRPEQPQISGRRALRGTQEQ